VALNGRDANLPPAMRQSLTTDRETAAVGVRFSLSLDLSSAAANRAGWARERAAAELGHERKVFEEEQEWTELAQRIGDSRQRVRLAQAIEAAQEAKLSRERQRLENGRSTTYQVLLFQQEYAQARIARLRTELELLSAAAQMKLFGGSR
jgi:outer membrane protein TolC